MERGIGTMDWMIEYTSLSNDSIKEKILYPFKNELKPIVANISGGKGKRLYVNKEKFADWMDENFERIDW